MLSVQKRVAKKKGAKRTSLGKSLEATANSLQAARALGNITNLIDSLYLPTITVTKRKARQDLHGVGQQGVTHRAKRVISENVVKTCPKVGTGANYAVARINTEEKKIKAIEQQSLDSLKECHDFGSEASIPDAVCWQTLLGLLPRLQRGWTPLRFFGLEETA
jgi:hypothetical protein